MVLTKPVTVEELEQYAGDERYELIQGELVPMSPTSHLHGVLVFRLAMYLGNYIDQRRSGTAAAGEPGVVIERDPDTVLAPDAFVMLSASGSLADTPPGFARTMPDLVVEVFSDSDRWPQARRKIALYFAAGIPHAWIVHPTDRSVAWMRADGRQTILTGSEVLDGGDLLPGFRLPLDTLFR
ncbi:MAG: Uma2 family endonuclease [Chloroflexota bacterium]|nr:Uma2 family endonuclease [Chloroflexota bacterium]